MPWYTKWKRVWLEKQLDCSHPLVLNNGAPISWASPIMSVYDEASQGDFVFTFCRSNRGSAIQWEEPLKYLNTANLEMMNTSAMKVFYFIAVDLTLWWMVCMHLWCMTDKIENEIHQIHLSNQWLHHKTCYGVISHTKSFIFSGGEIHDVITNMWWPYWFLFLDNIPNWIAWDNLIDQKCKGWPH